MTNTFATAVHGVGIAPITPFSADLERVDEQALTANLTFLVEAGLGLLYPCGNTGEGNFAPRTALTLFNALVADDRSLALRTRDRCAPFEDLRAHDGSANNVPAAVRTAMGAAGLAGGAVRPPMLDLNEATAHKARAIVESWEDG